MSRVPRTVFASLAVVLWCTVGGIARGDDAALPPGIENGPTTAPRATLTIAVRGRPEAVSIFIDGLKSEGKVGEPFEIDPGSHWVELRAPGYFTEGRSIKVPPFQSLKLDFDLTLKEPEGIDHPRPGFPKPEPPRGSSPQLIIGLTFGGIGLLTGLLAAVTGGAYAARQAVLDGMLESGRCTEHSDGTFGCGSPGEVRTAEDIDEETDRLTIATVVLGSSCALFLAVGIAVAATSPSPTRSTVQIAPLVAKSGAGLSAIVSF